GFIGLFSDSNSPHLDPPVSYCKTPTPITSLRISHSFSSLFSPSLLPFSLSSPSQNLPQFRRRHADLKDFIADPGASSSSAVVWTVY
ncbi:hypothetical protein Csa_002641, partial [Cucumis sativus]